MFYDSGVKKVYTAGRDPARKAMMIDINTRVMNANPNLAYGR